MISSRKRRVKPAEPFRLRWRRFSGPSAGSRPRDRCIRCRKQRSPSPMEPLLSMRLPIALLKNRSNEHLAGHFYFRFAPAHRENRNVPNSPGMTLVELVLAVGLFSFLMASAGHLVLTSLRVQRSWGQVAAPAQSAEHALTRLAQDLQAAQPFFGIPFQVTGGGAGLEFA